jgi:hypothetical protein
MNESSGAVTRICGKRDSPSRIHKCGEPRGHEGPCICCVAKNIELERCGLRFSGERLRKKRGAVATLFSRGENVQAVKSS